MKRILIIQTAFIGDVILATPLIEKLSGYFENAKIDFLLRKGNEILLKNHPMINEVLIWDKTNNKNKNLFKTLRDIRNNNYDYVINIQRFTSTGILTAFSNAKNKIGFRNNPLSILFSRRISHQFQNGLHEIDRNLKLVEHLTNTSKFLPKLYPTTADYASIKRYTTEPYVCIAPTSVWFTKQFPSEKWIQFINLLPKTISVYLLGGPADYGECQKIVDQSTNGNCQNLAGEINLIESAALMHGALMNYVNDSAPLHIASAMNAPVSSIFCSTIPDFGFGPLSDKSSIIQTKKVLDCRPCGIHGLKKCPLNTFECAYSIDINDLLSQIPG